MASLSYAYKVAGLIFSGWVDFPNIFDYLQLVERRGDKMERWNAVFFHPL
jgi:hypothetical protein